MASVSSDSGGRIHLYGADGARPLHLTPGQAQALHSGDCHEIADHDGCVPTGYQGWEATAGRITRLAFQVLSKENRETLRRAAGRDGTGLHLDIDFETNSLAFRERVSGRQLVQLQIDDSSGDRNHMGLHTLVQQAAAFANHVYREESHGRRLVRGMGPGGPPLSPHPPASSVASFPASSDPLRVGLVGHLGGGGGTELPPGGGGAPHGLGAHQLGPFGIDPAEHAAALRREQQLRQEAAEAVASMREHIRQDEANGLFQ